MSKFSYFFFLWTHQYNCNWNCTYVKLLIANHLDQSLWSTNEKYWAAVRSNLLHFFLAVQNCVAPFTGDGMLHKFGAEKLISWAKPVHFDLFTINFYCLESHIEHRRRCSNRSIFIWEFLKDDTLACVETWG
jgi:hypothetical protein